MGKYIHVRLRREVVQALNALGRKGETYSDIIERLIAARKPSPLTSQRDPGETTDVVGATQEVK
jgi:predicted CopG family antitoxin